MVARQIAMVSVQQVSSSFINFLHWLCLYREDSPRKRRARRPRTSHLSTRTSLLLKKLYMSQNLHMSQKLHQSKKKSQTFLQQLLLNLNKKLPKISSEPFLLEASIRLTLLQVINLQLLRILSKEDMLVFSSAQLQSKSLSMQFMRTLCT